MLRSAILLGLVATVLAKPHHLNNEQFIRLGNVENSFSFLNGLLVPVAKSSDTGIPTFEFRSIVNGAPVPENDYFSYRCGIIDNYYATYQKAMSPAFLCHNVDFQKVSSSPADSSMAVFVLSSEQLSLAPGVKEINLLFGKSAYHNFVAANPGIATVSPSIPAFGNAKAIDVRRKYDGYSVISGDHPFQSFLVPSTDYSLIRGSEDHNIQVANVPRAARDGSWIVV